jgi:CheY-like chemotaxis protein
MATILIVDDEFSLVDSITEVLQWEGHRVLAASHGAEGLEVLEGERPDLILLDQMMPVLGGIEMLGRLRADVRHHDLVVVLMSAAPLRSVPGLSWEGFLRKPFDVGTLLQTVGEALKKSAARRGGGGSGAGNPGSGSQDGGSGGGQGGGAGGPVGAGDGGGSPAGRGRHLTVVAAAVAR